jgi:hypothetical protein
MPTASNRATPSQSEERHDGSPDQQRHPNGHFHHMILARRADGNHREFDGTPPQKRQ